MTLIQSMLLGVLQGLAEFLPISSSGHLAVAQKLFGLDDIPLLFDVFLHLATLLAVLIFFRKKIWSLLCTFARLIFRKAPEIKSITESSDVLLAQELDGRRYILAIILTTLVTGALGLVVEKGIGDLPIAFVFCGFIFTALVLIFSALTEKIREKKLDYKNAGPKAPSWWQALLIGVAQGIGTLPGVSRSGSTISGALFCGVSRSVAGEYSFIASIPAILGAFLLEVKDLGDVSESIGFLPVLVGCISAFVVGYFSLAVLMKIIRKGKLEWFACYLIPAGVLGLIFLA